MNKKIINGLNIGFGIALAVGGVGMFFFPDQMVELLCPRKPLFGAFMLFAAALLFKITKDKE